jgi:hypothetical protein
MVSTVKSHAGVRLYSAVIWPLFICCTMQMGFFRSCQRAHSDTDTQKSNMLRERVKSLQNEPLGPIDLGNAVAAPTANTEYIINQKQEAVPFLVQALNEEKKPVLVGYAAYCLRRIGSNQGREAATRAYDKLAGKGENLSIEERFARSELKNYLEQVPD